MIFFSEADWFLAGLSTAGRKKGKKQKKIDRRDPNDSFTRRYGENVLVNLKLLKMKNVGLIAFFLMIAASFNVLEAQAKMVSYETAKDVVDIAIASEAHTTLVAAVKAAGLVETLKGEGPFTIFAPTNAAFDKLPEGTVATLLKPENKATLTQILTYHVIAGELDSKAVVAAIEAGNGTATVETVSGGQLKAMLVDGNVWLEDENGGKAQVTVVDLKGENGVIHVIDAVVLPK